MQIQLIKYYDKEPEPVYESQNISIEAFDDTNFTLFLKSLGYSFTTHEGLSVFAELLQYSYSNNSSISNENFSKKMLEIFIINEKEISYLTMSCLNMMDQ